MENNENPMNAVGLNKDSFEWYRRYWLFVLILLFALGGTVIGLVILSKGDVYKKENGTYQPISKKEKVILVVIAIIGTILVASRLFAL